ncbi:MULTISPECIES: hypothetical protein [unclassified Virgibacillus]|uniref:hypothetical protein n=1 Tax=unclassified Virgibacillus TaxID=2620237 RepID=UPI0024DE5D99|nr:hypothetical protein [Virgibacillus sp. LDC-1]
MGPYLFVVAALLAVLPILFVFKISVERIKENPQQKERTQSFFFIGVAICEIIPIILIIFGMINMMTVSSIDELFIPGLILLFLMGFASFFIFLQRVFDVEEDVKGFMNTFAMVGIAMVNAVPIIAIVSLLMMMP